MLGCRAQVLAEREDGDIVLAEVVHRAEDFVAALAEAEHDAALGRDLAIDHRLGFFQHAEAALVLRARADERGEAFDRFDVVVEDVRACIHDHLQRPVAVIEIGHEHLDDDRRVCGADCFDGLFEMLGATIAQVVTGNGGDHHMA